jgi:hypothetical protein
MPDAPTDPQGIDPEIPIQELTQFGMIDPDDAPCTPFDIFRSKTEDLGDCYERPN